MCPIPMNLWDWEFCLPLGFPEIVLRFLPFLEDINIFIALFVPIFFVMLGLLHIAMAGMPSGSNDYFWAGIVCFVIAGLLAAFGIYAAVVVGVFIAYVMNIETEQDQAEHS